MSDGSPSPDLGITPKDLGITNTEAQGQLVRNNEQVYSDLMGLVLANKTAELDEARTKLTAQKDGLGQLFQSSEYALPAVLRLNQVISSDAAVEDRFADNLYKDSVHFAVDVLGENIEAVKAVINKSTSSIDSRLKDADPVHEGMSALSSIVIHGKDEDTRKNAYQALVDVEQTLVERVEEQPFGYAGTLRKIVEYRNANEEVKSDGHFKVLEKYGLPTDQVFNLWRDSIWNKSEHEVVEAIERNLIAIKKLQEQRPNTDIVKRLFDKYNIACFARYPLEMLVAQYDGEDDKTRPQGVLLFATLDHNGYLNNKVTLLKSLFDQSKEAGYNLRLFESNGRGQVVSQLRQVNEQHGPISFLVIAGHGTADSIEMGPPEKSRGVITLADIARTGAGAVGKLLEDEASILLFSCSTGKKDGVAQHLSNTYQGLEIIGPDRDSSPRKITVIKREGKPPRFAMQYSFRGTRTVHYLNGDRREGAA